MRYYDMEMPKLKSIVKRVTIDTEAVARMIYNDGSLDFMDDYSDDEESI